MRTELECLEEADRCERQARTFSSPELRANLLKVAAYWRGLAAQQAAALIMAPVLVRKAG